MVFCHCLILHMANRFSEESINFFFFELDLLVLCTLLITIPGFSYISQLCIVSFSTNLFSHIAVQSFASAFAFRHGMSFTCFSLNIKAL